MQREQWNDIEWPHLTIYKDMPMVAGQRYYDYPPQLPFDSIFRIWWPQGVTWVPLDYGINPQTYATMGGENIQAWPPRRWRNCALYDEISGQTQPAAQFEVWPTPGPSTPFSLAHRGQRAVEHPCRRHRHLRDRRDADRACSLRPRSSPSKRARAPRSSSRRPTSTGVCLMARLGAQQRSMKSLSKDGGHMGPLADGRRLTPYLDFIPAVPATRRTG